MIVIVRFALSQITLQRKQWNSSNFCKTSKSLGIFHAFYSNVISCSLNACSATAMLAVFQARMRAVITRVSDVVKVNYHANDKHPKRRDSLCLPREHAGHSLVTCCRV